jgi:hypothetical protein
MKLIADSGSTKTSWCLSGNNDFTEYFSTGGLNPFFRSTEDIANELREKLFPKIDAEIAEIYFYGAGIINEEKGNIVKNALLQFFQRQKSRYKAIYLPLPGEHWEMKAELPVFLEPVQTLVCTMALR